MVAVPGRAVRGETRPVPTFIQVVCPSAAIESSLNEANQLIEDGEFELELDGVKHGFDGRLINISIGVFQTDQDDVHANTYRIDENQLPHDSACHAMRDRLQYSSCCPEVDCGDYALLKAETRELNSFHDVEHPSPSTGVWRIAAYGEDNGGNMESQGVEDDHPENVTHDPRVTDNEMQPRVEDECLARHHTHPAYLDKRNGRIPCGRDVQLEDEAKCMQCTSPRTDEQGPEVEAAVALEGQKYRQIELNHESPGHGGAGGQHRVLDRVIRESSSQCTSGRHV